MCQYFWLIDPTYGFFHSQINWKTKLFTTYEEIPIHEYFINWGYKVIAELPYLFLNG